MSVELKGRIRNCENPDAVYENLKELFSENISCEYFEDIEEAFGKENNDVLFDIPDCYGHYGAITGYMANEFLKDFPGIVFAYHELLCWDNGEAEVRSIISNGQVITQNYCQMSPGLSTTLKIDGTREQCLEIMKVLCCCANEMAERYRETEDGWFLFEIFDSPEREVEKRWDSGKMELRAEGPFGHFKSLATVDLFQKIADAAPACSFTGSISGWLNEDQSCEAEFNDGVLYLKHFSVYEPQTE